MLAANCGTVTDKTSERRLFGSVSSSRQEYRVASVAEAQLCNCPGTPLTISKRRRPHPRIPCKFKLTLMLINNFNQKMSEREHILFSETIRVNHTTKLVESTKICAGQE
jgi:hypothetical protein